NHTLDSRRRGSLDGAVPSTPWNLLPSVSISAGDNGELRSLRSTSSSKRSRFSLACCKARCERPRKRMANNHSEIEKRLWASADELRANSKSKSSEYSVPVSRMADKVGLGCKATRKTSVGVSYLPLGSLAA